MPDEQSEHTGRRLARIAVILGAAGSILALLVMGGPIEILKGAMCGKSCAPGGLNSFVGAVNSIDGPATDAVASVSGLGILMGGGLLAIAHQSASKVLAMSAGTGLVVVLARGIIS